MTKAEERHATKMIFVSTLAAIAIFTFLVAMAHFIGSDMKNQKDRLLQECLSQKEVSDCYIDMMMSD